MHIVELLPCVLRLGHRSECVGRLGGELGLQRSGLRCERVVGDEPVGLAVESRRIGGELLDACRFEPTAETR
jgi:hypothetical protein